MPLFGRDTSDTTANWEPQAADGRLAQTAGATPGGVFTSDLSVSEYVLLGEGRGSSPLGFRGRLLDLSHRPPGHQVEPEPGAHGADPGDVQHARELAMSRMQAEADHLGADGIVGVQHWMQAHVWG